MSVGASPVGWVFLTGILLFLSLVIPVICLVEARRFPGGGRFVAVSALLIVLSAPLMLSVEHYSWLQAYPQGHHSVIYPLVEAAPLAPLLTVAAALLLAACVVTFRFIRWSGRRLSERSVYEGLDYLPEGVCFGDMLGLPMLVNDQMHEILYAAFGVATIDMNEMRRRLAHGELRPGCKTTVYAGGIYLLLPDGTVWDLREVPIKTRQGSCTELLAFNVTDLYRGTEELKARNERLSAVNRQIREYGKNLDNTVREREILDAKIRLHDEFGKSLLAIRSYLSGENEDREALLALLKTPVFLFRQEDGESDADDAFALLEEAAAAVGVAVYYPDEMPETHKEVLAVAIHECITNTVKHANGHNLYINSLRGDGGWTVEFTNDGAPPAGPVAETGGLGNLRALCERTGCGMRIESAPRFRLVLKL